jgi:2-amino-4-hydroxy-6-hydroxymethyldihydropteridine diphosphokinase
MADCLISFGSNQGDPRAALGAVSRILADGVAMGPLRVSRLWRTRPIGSAGQGDYANAAIRLSTRLAPRELLAELLAIEARLGRVRRVRWGPRVVDLDLLLYDQLCLQDLSDPATALIVPHPRMSFRRFALAPAAEVAGDMFHPQCRCSVAGLLRHLDAAPQTIAIVGGQAIACDVAQLIAARHVPALPGSGVSPGMDFSCEVTRELATGEFAPDGRHFGIALVESAAHWTDWKSQVKLLVRATPEAIKLSDWERAIFAAFVGPRLELETHDVAATVDEIEAAIAAMLPASVDAPTH